MTRSTAAEPAPMRFDAYMERCLYDPVQGFYTAAGGSAGRRRGDFITSPEVGPLFAQVLARALDWWWDELERPEPFLVYDAGTGPGTLAGGLAAAPGRSAEARRVVGFDRPDPHGAPLPDLGGAIVIANELLDNLPFRILERHGAGWREVHVVTDDEGRASETLVPLDEPDRGELAFALPDLDTGARIPLLEQAHRWVAAVLDRGPAVLLVIDYGAPTTAELAGRGGWLRTYRHHERSDDPYHEPGRWDITTDVAFDQLPSPDELTDQARFLRRWGIEELLDEAREYWEANAAVADLAALKMRSRFAEADALLDPLGLGSWLVGIWSQF